VKVLLKVGRRPWFSTPDPQDVNQLVGSLRHISAVHRLIAMGLLRAHYVAGYPKVDYAYHWTYLGKLALVKLRIRSRIDDHDPNEVIDL
jgi:hypothetical protein